MFENNLSRLSPLLVGKGRGWGRNIYHQEAINAIVGLGKILLRRMVGEARLGISVKIQLL